MKKILCFATLFFAAGCYTPMNNSGMATTKAWLEIPAVRTDFDGKQYDACYQFNLSFLPPGAKDGLDLQAACISACCWQSDKPVVRLNLNENFERDLAAYGRARRYEPGIITLKTSRSSLLNTANVSVSPKGVISRNGVVKVTYEEVDDPARIRQVARQKQADAQRLAQQRAQRDLQEEQALLAEQNQARLNLAATVLQRQKAAVIDRFFYQMEKAYKQKSQVFLLGSRVYVPRATQQTNVYSVTCSAPIQTGVSLEKLTPQTVSCGRWNVNIDTLFIVPASNRARQIDQ